MILKKSLIVLLPLLVFLHVLFADFVSPVFGAYADQRILLSFLVVSLTAGGVFRCLWRGQLVPAIACLWPYILLVFSFLLTVLYDECSPYCLIEPVFYSLYFLAFGIFGHAIRAEGANRAASLAVLMLAAVACFFYAAMTIIVYLFAINDQFAELGKIIPWGFVNIRYWSHIATWLLPLLPLCLLVTPCKGNRLWQLGVTFTAATWWWIVFMSSSRGSLVGMSVGFFLVWSFFGRIAWPWMKLFVRFAVYGMILWLVFSLLVPSLVFDDLHVRGIKGDSSGRMPLWKEAWAMSLQNFPFGMGPQSWLTHDILTGAYRVSPKFGHPHNMYLMWAAEYGWISIAGLAILGSAALRRLRLKISMNRVEDHPESLWLVAFSASVTAAIIHAGVSAVFIAPGSMLVGLLILSVFWALITPEFQSSALSSVSKRSIGPMLAGYGAAFIFLVAGSLWFREVLRYQQAMADDLPYHQAEVSQGMLPRFWFHGNFPRHPSQMPEKN